ncbi:YhgE/Pip domain-containing protein [Gottfriedia luciferensis]|uniref:YhgE/Pip domain-containing protein n=1 Tax=Gottfriedia luciferensis TaxID=178774 RepID=UPI000B446717|nr:YhgE/Pip domain-containing protein [Gottfriedia luciferensis]
MLKQEWKNIFKKPMMIATIISVGLVPMLYSLIFLSAYWNPYNHTEKLSVAVVNNDKGTEFNNKQLNVGKDFVDGLKDNHSFKWKITNKKQAMEGLNDEKYYLVIELPSNFSKNAATLLDEKPQKMKLNYYTNAGKNYVGAQIGSNAIKEVNAKLSKEITEQYAKSVFDNFKDIGNGMTKASDGAGKINDGATKITDGTGVLNKNLKKLNDSMLTFENGSSKLKSGASQLSDGIKQSNDGANKLSSGLNTLLEGTATLKDGSSDLNNGLSQLADGGKKLGDGSTKLEAGTSQLTDGLKQSYEGAVQLQKNEAGFNDKLGTTNAALKSVVNDIQNSNGTLSNEDLQKLLAISKGLDQLSQGSNQIKAGFDQVAAAQNKLYDGSNNLLAGQQQLNSNLNLFNSKLQLAANGANQLAQGSNDLYNGTKQLSEGSTLLSSGLGKLNVGGDQLVQGIDQLNDGSKQLTDGTNKLYNGSGDLLKGATDLTKGTTELHKSLKEGGDEVNKVKTNDETDKFFANPTKLVGHKLNNVKEYGVGLTPYILSIGLFAGGLMFTSVYPMRKNSIEPTSGLAWFFSKYSVLIIMGIMQAIIADIVLIYGMGLNVQNVGYFVFFTIITSLTFYSLIQFLTVTLGNIGQYLVFIMMLLQIGGTSGTFPIALTPTFFQNIHPYLPMTYAIKGFRELISDSVNTGFVMDQIYYLCGFAVLFILLTNVTFAVRVKLSKKQKLSESEAM